MNHLTEREWNWWVDLFKRLNTHFENKEDKFNLLDYDTLTLRDVCEEVWFIWLKDTMLFLH